MRIRIQSRIIRVFAPITGKKQYYLLETILERTPEIKKTTTVTTATNI